MKKYSTYPGKKYNSETRNATPDLHPITSEMFEIPL